MCRRYDADERLVRISQFSPHGMRVRRSMLSDNGRQQGLRGADLLADVLLAAGVKRIFSLSGNQIMPIYDACLDAGIEIVHTRHEAAAVFMADAWAQLTRGLGVALVTAAPGAMNALGALYSARCSESPVLLLTGDSPLGQDGRGAFQELDQVAVTRTLTKTSLRPHDATSLLASLQEAIRAARSGRLGPAHIALPFDVIQGSTADVGPCDERMLAPASSPAREDELTVVATGLAQAERPIVVVGPSLSPTRTGTLLETLADRLDAPVLCMESPRGVRDPALGELAAVLSEADLIVSLGKSVDFTLGFGKVANDRCRWLVVESDAAERQRASTNLGQRLDHCFEADVMSFARALADRAPASKGRDDWRRTVSRRISARTSAVPAEGGADDAITSADLCEAVRQFLAGRDESVVVSDGGEFGQWAQAFFSGPSRIVNGVSGAIGGGVPYGLAAALARPDAAVVVLTGDGSIGFHLAEFETAARVGARFVVVVGNDRRWNAEHQIQLRDYGSDRLVGCDLGEARYDLAAKAMGGHGEYVTSAAELAPALERAFEAGTVACVNVLIEGLPAPAGSAH